MADPKSYIGALVQAIVGTPTTTDASGFATLFGGSPVTIGQVLEHGPIGDSHADVAVTTLAGRTFHSNGAADGGETTITFAYDSAGNTGQQLLLAQNGTNNTVSFKITDPDGKLTYFFGLVRNFRDNPRSATTMKGFTVSLAINSATIRPSF